MSGLTDAEREAVEWLERSSAEFDDATAQQHTDTVCAALRRLTAPRAEGVDLTLSREDAGIVMDALIDHCNHSNLRKAVNEASSSNVRAATCERLIGEIGALTAAAPKVAAPQAEAGEFDSWWNASKYRQVILADDSMRQIALDGWNAALAPQRSERGE